MSIKPPTSGIPTVLNGGYGRRERYLLLTEEGNVGVARDGSGEYQPLLRDASALGGWTCVKYPVRDYAEALRMARQMDTSDVMPHEVAEIAIAAYEAKGYLVNRVGAGTPGGRFATYQIQTPNGLQVFTIRVEEN